MMGRAARKWLVTVAVLTVAASAFWFFALRPIQEHRWWHEWARAGIYALADKRPADVPPGRWEFMVGWTLNLHSNCGTWHTWVDREQMWPYLDELERRLHEPVSVATIDWIWDEYARITKGGRGYGERYRPTHSSDLEFAQPGCFGIRVK
jgi:hypothetical protein